MKIIKKGKYQKLRSVSLVPIVDASLSARKANMHMIWSGIIMKRNVRHAVKKYILTKGEYDEQRYFYSVYQERKPKYRTKGLLRMETRK